MSENFIIRDAAIADGDGMLALMPRLADFDIPERREPGHLWRDDAALLRRWLDGDAEACLAQVAAAGDSILGLTLTRLRPEPLSREPAAHLEVIAVAANTEGRGIGKALMAAAEKQAVEHGARFLTLHVFASNTRARSLYEKCGFDGELLRYIKSLS